MSMMRSFTTRRKPSELDGQMSLQLGRAASQRAGRPITRTQISGPVALVSTTNMLSYNAPDIVHNKPEQHSASSSEESDGSANSVHSQETDPTDLSSADASPISEPNHLNQFFKPVESTPVSSSPSLPRRAPSHSKRAHEVLSRKRSVQRALSPVKGRVVPRASIDAAVEAPRENPFGKELAQLDAVAEEFASAHKEDTETLYLRSRGLGCFAALEYLSEIDSLVHILLDDKSPTVPDFSGWF